MFQCLDERHLLFDAAMSDPLKGIDGREQLLSHNPLLVMLISLPRCTVEDPEGHELVVDTLIHDSREKHYIMFNKSKKI